MKMLDLVYHGYEWDITSRKYQDEFRKGVETYFPELHIRDSYDEYKGYRTVVECEKDFDEINYFAFIFAFGLENGSMMFHSKQEEYDNGSVLQIIRENWPEQLKEEYR